MDDGRQAAECAREEVLVPDIYNRVSRARHVREIALKMFMRVHRTNGMTWVRTIFMFWKKLADRKERRKLEAQRRSDRQTVFLRAHFVGWKRMLKNEQRFLAVKAKPRRRAEEGRCCIG